MNKHTMGDLAQMQSLPLKYKIIMTQQRIRGWYDYFDGQVYVSFSGGKDSTVLVDIITKMGYTDIPLVFVDTGLEYPEIREFVKGYGDRVTWLRPKMNFKQVIEKYGYPFIGKDVSKDIYAVRSIAKNRNIDYKDVPYFQRNFRKTSEYCKKHPSFCKERWSFIFESDFSVSDKCCNEMKKKPVKDYEHKTGRKPIMAIMASESRMRTTTWLKLGCNAFEAKRQISNPMSFWTEQDVLQYIQENDVKICSVYGDIVTKNDGTYDGQMRFDIDGLISESECELKTTGRSRTGCMFCGFGCHLENEETSRFAQMKETHPKQYEYIMKPWSEGGLGYKEVIDWINEHGKLNIRY